MSNMTKEDAPDLSILFGDQPVPDPRAMYDSARSLVKNEPLQVAGPGGNGPELDDPGDNLPAITVTGKFLLWR